MERNDAILISITTRLLGVIVSAVCSSIKAANIGTARNRPFTYRIRMRAWARSAAMTAMVACPPAPNAVGSGGSSPGRPRGATAAATLSAPPDHQLASVDETVGASAALCCDARPAGPQTAANPTIRQARAPGAPRPARERRLEKQWIVEGGEDVHAAASASGTS